jgi:flagella basal body P-ring formation protein FlgA
MKRLVTTFGVWLLCTGAAIASPATEALSTALLDQISAQLAVARSRLSLGPSELPELSGPLADYRFEFGSTPRGRTVVRGLSEKFRNVTFTIDVRLWDSAWVVTSPVERAAVLAPEQLSRSWLDVTDLSAWSGRDLSGQRARRTLRPGVPLTNDAVEPVPLIVRGRPVTLTAASSALKVSRSGVALSDARLGEPVRVRVDRQTIISATAAGPDLCVVGF